MKQKFNVTGMTCSACSVPHEMNDFAGAPFDFIYRRGGVNPPAAPRHSARVGGAAVREGLVHP